MGTEQIMECMLHESRDEGKEEYQREEGKGDGPEQEEIKGNEL